MPVAFVHRRPSRQARTVNACGIRLPPTEPTGENGECRWHSSTADRADRRESCQRSRLRDCFDSAFGISPSVKNRRFSTPPSSEGGRGAGPQAVRWSQLFAVLQPHDNPSVTASPCHLPLHKGGIRTANDLRLRKDYALGLEKFKAPSDEGGECLWHSSTVDRADR